MITPADYLRSGITPAIAFNLVIAVMAFVILPAWLFGLVALVCCLHLAAVLNIISCLLKEDDDA